MKDGKHTLVTASLVNLGLVSLAAVLFTASFPNPLFANGLSFAAWLAYVPVFWVTRRAGIAACAVFGAFYGYASYTLFNYWLTSFHPVAAILVGSIYLVYMALLFPLLHIAFRFFPRRGYILQFLLWMAYEYLRTLGFLGYSYGISGYSQWSFLPLIQIASITGVWGVSALVVFPAAWLSAALHQPSIKNFFHRERVPILVWFALLAASLVYGFASPVNYTQARKLRFALVQHNTDPWNPSHLPVQSQALAQYRNDFLVLQRLSDEALQAHPDTDFVVWSETAFVPRIYWHQTIRDDPASWRLVRELLDYLAAQNVPFLIGNNDGRKEPAVNPSGDNRVSYNAAILFDKGEIAEVYRKMHLVPFTEYFPYKKQFPAVYAVLKNANTYFWEAGKERTIFQHEGIRFASPICFEDTFGYISRDFVRNGAEVIVNLSNDVWAKSLPAQMQHLGMAVFRTVENRRSMVRSTSSGQTAAIDPNGRILAMAEPFTEAWLSAEVPLVDTATLYTRYGDYLGVFFTAAACALLLYGIVLYILEIVQRRTRLTNCKHTN